MWMHCGGDLQRVAREMNIADGLMSFSSTSDSSTPSKSTPVGVKVVLTVAHNGEREKLQDMLENREKTKLRNPINSLLNS